ncbi:hypothetical protein [Paraburkholderia sp. HD33-4]|uniref:hypothetical protein n=1 Tax=Paraburkholderia sp. HD33-4 TaxID=2883242 RepID=UPI001F2C02DE|nr:hypothetical protein [Paraburkholderia sp. HD33-4]
MTPDDIAMQAIFGKGFRADQSAVAAEESARSAADPTRRTVVENVNAGSGWYKPSRSIQGADVDEGLGLRPGVAGLHPDDDPDRHDHVEMVVDDLPEVEAAPAIDADICAYIESNPEAVLTTATLLTGALHMDAEHIGRGDEMELAEAMGRLGYEKTQRRIDGARVWVWVSRTLTDAVTNPNDEE